MTTVSDAYWADTARHLARLPGVVASLLDRHVAGPDGRCRECRSPTRAAPVWPCNLALLARQAAAVPIQPAVGPPWNLAGAGPYS